MDFALAAPFIKAITDVLTTMAATTPTAGKPYLKTGATAMGDVTGLVGMVGAKTGSVSISFDKACAIAIVKGMLGDDIQDIMQDVKDAVGEITNMVSGQARAGLAEMGIVMQGSTPTVIMGDNHSVGHATKAPIMAIPFTTDAGKFTIEFCFQ